MNPIALEDAFTPSSNLAWSIIYYNKDYWFHDSTPEATGKTATGSNAEVNVFLGSNTEYRKNQILTYSYYRSCLLTVIFSIISGEETRKLSLRRRHDAVRMRRGGRDPTRSSA